MPPSTPLPRLCPRRGVLPSPPSPRYEVPLLHMGGSFCTGVLIPHPIALCKEEGVPRHYTGRHPVEMPHSPAGYRRGAPPYPGCPHPPAHRGLHRRGPPCPQTGVSAPTRPHTAPDLDEQLDVEQRVAGGGEPGAQRHEQPLGALGPARPGPRPRPAARGRPRHRGQRRFARHGPAAAATAPAPPRASCVTALSVAVGGTIRRGWGGGDSWQCAGRREAVTVPGAPLSLDFVYAFVPANILCFHFMFVFYLTYCIRVVVV